MFKQGVGSFKYHVGISSLDQIATRDDRVCVLNILGGESSDVTPVGMPTRAGTWCSAPRQAAVARFWKRRSAMSRSTTMSERASRRGTASTVV